MAQHTFAANLSSNEIPLLSSLQAKTVIIGRNDQDFELDVNNQQKLQKERRIPQVYYCHNVMPTDQGYMSVGYSTKIEGLPSVTDFRGAFVLRDIDENKTLFSPSGGKNYIFDRNIAVWRSIGSLVGKDTALVTVAYLDGETYIFYEKTNCYKYNRTTQTLDVVTLTGLTVANINGICSSNGFLIAWDDTNTVYRSQSIDNLNFTPDPTLGSGSGIPEDIKGKITVILPITNGYIVYTTANAVAATFQQNIRYPFIYKEVEGSAGVYSPDHVSWQDNLGHHYALTTAGLQELNKTRATPVFPETTDFIASKIFETFDVTTKTFTTTKLTKQINVHVTAVGSRFVVISYGTGNIFTHAVVYDLAFKRFGKLKVDHVDCFTYAVPTLSGEITWEMLGELTWDELGDTTWADLGSQVETQEAPKEIIAFLGQDGEVKLVQFDLTRTDDDAVFICGKYQYTRGRWMALDEILIENIDPDSDYELFVLPSYDGKTPQPAVLPYEVPTSTGYMKHFLCGAVPTGLNQSIGVAGSFHILGLELTFHEHGRM